jgi:hypothetical protein
MKGYVPDKHTKGTQGYTKHQHLILVVHDWRHIYGQSLISISFKRLLVEQPQEKFDGDGRVDRDSCKLETNTA